MTLNYSEPGASKEPMMSTLGKDSSVPLIPYDLSDLGALTRVSLTFSAEG